MLALDFGILSLQSEQIVSLLYILPASIILLEQHKRDRQGMHQVGPLQGRPDPWEA